MSCTASSNRFTNYHFQSSTIFNSTIFKKILCTLNIKKYGTQQIINFICNFCFYRYKMKIISICLWLWFTFILKLMAEECSDSKKDNWIAISTNCTEKPCPLSKLARKTFWDSNILSKKNMYYSEVCMNQNNHQTKFTLRKQIKRPSNFKKHCGDNGNACKSGTTTVDYKQCYPG